MSMFNFDPKMYDDSDLDRQNNSGGPRKGRTEFLNSGTGRYLLQVDEVRIAKVAKEGKNYGKPFFAFDATVIEADEGSHFAAGDRVTVLQIVGSRSHEKFIGQYAAAIYGLPYTIVIPDGPHANKQIPTLNSDRVMALAENDFEAAPARVRAEAYEVEKKDGRVFVNVSVTPENGWPTLDAVLEAGYDLEGQIAELFG